MKRLLTLLLILCSLSLVHAVFEMVEVPEGSVGTIDTVIDAKIENVGFERIFVALPDGWVINDVNTYARSFAVLEEGLWRKYGDPLDRYSPLGSGLVYDETGLLTKQYYSLGTSVGWWLRPNEGVDIQVAIDSVSCSGNIDPQAIEEENRYIIVKKWEQEFTITPSDTGFITAPCVVERAALISAAPAPISDVSQIPSAIYYQDYDPSADTSNVNLGEVPSWDDWFTLTGSLSSTLSTKSIVGMEPVFDSSDADDVVLTQTPVWRIEDLRDIFYTYKWERGKSISGIELITGATFADVPEWFDWF
ncbi:MAG: hypothetical protein V3R57_01145 [Candidatus Bathyarchaeia archaeon]